MSFVRPPCRFCGEPLTHTFVDLGTTPLCQRHVAPADFDKPEPTWPLHAYVCGKCFLVQLPSYVPAGEIFDGNYAYFSSFSDTWLKHMSDYADAMTTKLGLNPTSRVMEAASNDGYLLQFFAKKNIPVLGIEPTSNTAAAARAKGIDTEVVFLGRQTAEAIVNKHGHADLVAGNNVLAHVPDLNDFVAGLATLLKPTGVLTMEFPHLLQLIRHNQFDTIYHEHYSYYWFGATQQIFKAHGVTLFDIEEHPTHGGSLRIFGQKTATGPHAISPRVAVMNAKEAAAGWNDLSRYGDFAENVRETKRKLLSFLIDAKRQGKKVAGYGAPGKGNTLLNYCGIRTDFLDFTVDKSPHKQNNFLPGSRIPIRPVEAIREEKPDYLLILPWNLKDEIIKQTSFIREWGGRWVVPIPEVSIHD
jgi:2-polyprenyl-3-methyl-5-hydroxy-6-metoxy-1,4-benzoquinol methylase